MSNKTYSGFKGKFLTKNNNGVVYVSQFGGMR